MSVVGGDFSEHVHEFFTDRTLKPPLPCVIIPMATILVPYRFESGADRDQELMIWCTFQDSTTLCNGPTNDIEVGPRCVRSAVTLVFSLGFALSPIRVSDVQLFLLLLALLTLQAYTAGTLRDRKNLLRMGLGLSDLKLCFRSAIDGGF